MSELVELVRDLARVRRDVSRLEAELKARRDAWRRRWEEENAELIAEWGHLNTTLQVLEDEVRKKAVEVARATGDKNPAPGVKIRVVTRLKYNPARAIDWALSRGMREVLTLNKKAFEKTAKALRPDVVEFEEELQPTIARDLDKALGLVPEIPPGAQLAEEAEAAYDEWAFEQAAYKEGPR